MSIEEMDGLAQQLADWLVERVKSLKQEIPRPAMSQKLTKAELWERYGEPYKMAREDVAAIQELYTQAGVKEDEVLEFDRALEKLYQEEIGWQQ